MKDFCIKIPNWHFFLDVEHCNTNDKTMIFADYLTKELKHKIKEILLSGYENFHDPLYRTKQIEIIQRCKEINAPIIIECTCEKSDGVEAVSKEFNYILENLK